MIKAGWIIGGALGLAAILPSEEPTPFPSIESKFQLVWKSRIGNASFRTNVLLQKDRLWIGSNGEAFMDRGLIEPTSGVYSLDRRTGKKLAHFANESFGDMDVNGLLIYRNRLYFGNDNEEFLCTDLNGKILWRNPASGDIEHEPIWVQARDKTVIVYAAESGEVKAVNPETGNTVWSYYIPEFDGWRPGDNRSVFKIKAWFQNTSFFYTRPLVVDLNEDGVNDLIYQSYGGVLLALDGNNGKKMWSSKEDEPVNIGMGIVGSGKQKKIVCLRSFYTSPNIQNEIIFYSLRGEKLKSVSLSESSWGGGLNVLSVADNEVLINSRTHTYKVTDQGLVTSMDRSLTYTYTGWDGKIEQEYRNGRDPLFADHLIALEGGKQGVIVLNQYDNGSSNVGFVEILALESGKVLDRFSLPARGEMPPLIQDVDGDGDLDMLFAGYDGYLYCYQLPKY